jgi:hypothetical protein
MDGEFRYKIRTRNACVDFFESNRRCIHGKRTRHTAKISDLCKSWSKYHTSSHRSCPLFYKTFFSFVLFLYFTCDYLIKVYLNFKRSLVFKFLTFYRHFFAIWHSCMMKKSFFKVFKTSWYFITKTCQIIARLKT